MQHVYTNVFTDIESTHIIVIKWLIFVSLSYILVLCRRHALTLSSLHSFHKYNTWTCRCFYFFGYKILSSYWFLLSVHLLKMFLNFFRRKNVHFDSYLYHDISVHSSLDLSSSRHISDNIQKSLSNISNPSFWCLVDLC